VKRHVDISPAGAKQPCIAQHARYTKLNLGASTQYAAGEGQGMHSVPDHAAGSHSEPSTGSRGPQEMDHRPHNQLSHGINQDPCQHDWLEGELRPLQAPCCLLPPLCANKTAPKSTPSERKQGYLKCAVQDLNHSAIMTHYPHVCLPHPCAQLLIVAVRELGYWHMSISLPCTLLRAPLSHLGQILYRSQIYMVAAEACA